MLVNLQLNVLIVELFHGLRNVLINQDVQQKCNFLYVSKREKYNYPFYKDLKNLQQYVFVYFNRWENWFFYE